jgi:hypothetical protein
MCQKYQRRCATVLAFREQALAEWCQAETLHEVRVAWGRLGRRVTLHRYGQGHFAELAGPLALLGPRRGGQTRRGSPTHPLPIHQYPL